MPPCLVVRPVLRVVLHRAPRSSAHTSWRSLRTMSYRTFTDCPGRQGRRGCSAMSGAGPPPRQLCMVPRGLSCVGLCVSVGVCVVCMWRVWRGGRCRWGCRAPAGHSVPVASRARAAGSGGALRFYSDFRGSTKWGGGPIIMETGPQTRTAPLFRGCRVQVPVPAGAPFLLGMC